MAYNKTLHYFTRRLTRPMLKTHESLLAIY